MGYHFLIQTNIVAPLVGARIEIAHQGSAYDQPPSLPSWERGLKCEEITALEKRIASLPSWERGLKSVHVDLTYAIRGRSPRGSAD